MNDTGEIVGMVDVLKLTYATLEQVWRQAPDMRFLLTILDQHNVDWR